MMMNASCEESSGATADQTNYVSVMASGEGKLSSPPEYLRLTRLRHRRLMAYLWRQGFPDSYNELVKKTRAVMSLAHLRSLIELGRWDDAVEYVDRFLPPATCHKSFLADVFRRFIVMLHRFADAAAGKEDKWLPKHYLQLNHQRDVSHADLRLRSICMSVIAVHSVRANMNWQRVWTKATSLIYMLAHCVPELRGCFSLPTTGIQPHHVLPIASGQCRMSSKIGSVQEATELLADLLDATVRAGVQTLSFDPSHPLQPHENEGMSKHEEEAGYHTIAARQDSDGRNNSRDELATVEQDRSFKWQRLNGALGEANLVMPGYCAMEILSAKPSGGETSAP